jgi:hypothetical protein
MIKTYFLKFQVFAHMVYICEAIAMFAFLCTRPSFSLLAASLAILIIAFPFFAWLSKQGKRLLAGNLRALQIGGQLRRMSVVDYE